VLTARLGGGYAALLSPMETLRTAAWIGFLVALLRTSWALDERLSSSFVIASTIGFVTAIKLGLDLVDAFGSGATSLHDAPIVAALFVVGRLTVAIPGLVLIHNLYVNAEPASGTGIRLLCIGLAGFFVYDLNLYTLRFLLGSMSSDLFNIRGAIDAITVPLLLLSARQAWVARVQVSRQVVFHTLSMSIIGGYLIVMALTAYGLRLVGGDWGRLLQITFLFATIILGAIVLVLPRCRSMLRLLISKHFFAYRYDYRTEWLRFIKTVSGIDAGSTATHRGRIPSLAARHGDFKGFTPAALTALNDWRLALAGQCPRTREQAQARGNHGRKFAARRRRPRPRREGSGVAQPQVRPRGCRPQGDPARPRPHRRQSVDDEQIAREQPPDALRPAQAIRHRRLALDRRAARVSCSKTAPARPAPVSLAHAAFAASRVEKGPICSLVTGPSVA